MDPFNLDDHAVIDTPADPPACAKCKADDDEIVDLEAAERWEPGVVYDVWRCPRCRHEVIRGDGGDRWV